MAAGRTPEFIGRWLDASDGANLAVLDGPQQFLGSEPNTLLAESGFDRGALWRGPASRPARCDLPATPRDMEHLEDAALPAFGIETRHQLLDFDVVGTSVSYNVLFAN